MSKFLKSGRVIDLSDYGRLPARWLVKFLLPIGVSAHFITIAFTLLGIFAGWLITEQEFFWAGLLLPMKSILDAADGEMARARNHPSYVGRYLDSTCDFLVGISVFAAIIWVTDSSWFLGLAAFLSSMFQCSIHHMYFLKKHYETKGDHTSRLCEDTCPTPYPWDNPLLLKALHWIYRVIYGWQDRLVCWLDPTLKQSKSVPNFFLTLVSLMGGGCQLLGMAFFLSFLGRPEWVLYFFLIPANIYAAFLLCARRYIL